MRSLQNKLERLEQKAKPQDDSIVLVIAWPTDSVDDHRFSIHRNKQLIANGVGIHNIPQEYRDGNETIVNLTWGDD